MNEKDVIDFGLELNRFLAERFKYSARFAKSRCDLWGSKVDIKTPKYRIVVSWKDYENTISITAISFTQTNAGDDKPLTEDIIFIVTFSSFKFPESYANYRQAKLSYVF
ncbi:MAG TPA: hypothetical protein VF433_09310 [Cellvibrio sp.]